MSHMKSRELMECGHGVIIRPRPCIYWSRLITLLMIRCLYYVRIPKVYRTLNVHSPNKLEKTRYWRIFNGYRSVGMVVCDEPITDPTECDTQLIPLPDGKIPTITFTGIQHQPSSPTLLTTKHPRDVTPHHLTHCATNGAWFVSAVQTRSFASHTYGPGRWCLCTWRLSWCHG